MAGGWGTPSWQGGEPMAGEVFVGDKTTQTARELLEACDRLGIDRISVRTVNKGFIVPEDVWESAQSARAEREGLAF